METLKDISIVILIFTLGYLIVYGDCVFTSTIEDFKDVEITSLTLGTVVKLFWGLFSFLITLRFALYLIRGWLSTYMNSKNEEN